MTASAAGDPPASGRLLVTGGSGFLGRHVVAAALDAGWQVTAAVHRQPVDERDARASWVTLDLRDASSVASVVAVARPDVVVHTAYVQGGPDLDAITHVGAGLVAAATAEAAAALVHLSTDVVFDGRRPAPQTYVELDPVAPLHAYGRAKAASEVAVAAAHPDALVVRTSMLYAGPGREPGAHEQVVLDTLAGRADWRFHTDEWRCPLLVDDLATVLVELAGREITETSTTGVRAPGGPRLLHVAGPEGITRARFAQLIAAAHGLDPAAVPTAPLTDRNRPANVMLDSSLARSQLTCVVRGVTGVFATCGGPDPVFLASRNPE